ALHSRMSMLGAVREFVLEQLAQHAPRDAVLAGAAARHAHYYSARAAELLPSPLKRTVDASRLAALRARDGENLIAAVEHALAPYAADIAAACSVVCALEPLLLLRGPSSELARLLERALSLAESSESALVEVAAARQLRARLLTPAGQLDRARADLEAALDTV